jgi:hypothetical protein
MHGHVRPVIVTSHEFVPAVFALLLPGAVLGHEAPQWCEVDDDAVVEVRIPEGSDACYLLAEGPQLSHKGLLLGNLLALARGGTSACSLHEGRELALLVLQLGRDVVVQNLIKGVLGEAVVVEPDGVARGGRGKLPVDRGFAMAFRVDCKMIGEERSRQPLRQTIVRRISWQIP